MDVRSLVKEFLFILGLNYKSLVLKKNLLYVF